MKKITLYTRNNIQTTDVKCSGLKSTQYINHGCTCRLYMKIKVLLWIRCPQGEA